MTKPRHARFTLSLLVLVFASTLAMSTSSDAAQDPPPVPGGETPPAEEKKDEGAAKPVETEPAPVDKLDEAVRRAVELQKAAAPVGPTDEEDAAARKVLKAAADRQGGRKLVAPSGSLESFQITLHKVIFESEKANEDGGTTKMQVEADDDGLILYWKGDQIRTFWSIDGKKTQRGKFIRNGSLVPWLNDGSKTTLLVGDQWVKDKEQVDRDQRIVRALLDVGILRTMLTDGSRWQVITDAAYPGVAIRRTPPAGKEVMLQLTLWIDAVTASVNAARLSPNAPDEATMYYSFGYDPTFPAVKGDKLIFPFEFAVFEQMGTEVPHTVMSGTVREVAFNTLADGDLSPPKTNR